MRFIRFITAVCLGLALSACLPGMAPKGAPSNPAGTKAPDGNAVATPSGPKDESSFGIEIPSDPSSAVPRALEVPVPPPSSFGSPNVVPGPSGAGGGGGYNDGSNQIARIGGGFCPKPDEVSLDDLFVTLDWRAFHGYGVWWELSKIEPASLAVGDNVPFDLTLNVEVLRANERCRYWYEPVPPMVVRLIFRPSGGEGVQAVDTITKEKHADGYNTEFHGLIAKNGRIDVYAYEVIEPFPYGTPKIPGGYRTTLANLPAIHDIAFTTDTAHAHYLGAFATKVTAPDTARDSITEPVRDKTMIRTPQF